MLATSIRLPTVDELRALSLEDLATAAGLADTLRDTMRDYVHIDPFCLPDPFGEKDDLTYSLVLDSENPNRVIAILANVKDPLPQLPWSTILGERLAKVQVSKEEALSVKQVLMPKQTNNFYPYRRGAKIAGYVTFAFQICGLG